MNGHTKWIVPLVVVLAFIIGNFVKPVLAINEQVIKNTVQIDNIDNRLDDIDSKLDALLIANGITP